MPDFLTHDLKQDVVLPENRQIYNGLDCMLTLEIYEEIKKLYNQEPISYKFALALQAPVLEIMQRGFAIDDVEKRTFAARLRVDIAKMANLIDIFARAVWDKGLNPRSPVQMKNFLYDTMQLPKQWSNKKGKKKLSTDRDALEKLEMYYYARPIIAAVLAYRDLTKQLSVIETEVSSDGRMRTSYNIAGTETGRWSSSASADGTGSNVQNIAPGLRRIFVADLDFKLCVIDLEQAESREVGWLCGILFDDWTYLDACYAGDLHTTTAKLIWPFLLWPGNAKGDRFLADSQFYREFSYRDMSKRGGHGTNYYGKPFTIARYLKVPSKLMEDFQNAYFKAYPAIALWHKYVAAQIQTVGFLVTPFERKRHFFGRANDDTTLREAIAFSPQSSTADRTNLGLYKIWKTMGKSVQLLAQTHDSVTFQYHKSENEKEIIAKALKCMEVNIYHKDRVLIVPGEAKVGWNWQNASSNNPDGLIKWKGFDARERHTGLNKIFS